jgi:putative ABC transport system substrate-binding protein
MRRRDVVKLILTSLAFDPVAARAQRAIPVVGALSPAARPALFETSFYVGFSQGMRELGYVEGTDYLIEWRFAGGDYARLPELANELIALKVDVLFATSTASVHLPRRHLAGASLAGNTRMFSNVTARGCKVRRLPN